MKIRSNGIIATRHYKKTAFAITVASAILLFATITNTPAHDDSMPGQGRVPAHTRDNMRAFAAEHHHNENLSAQSITTCSGGMAGGYPCSNIDLMAFLPLSQIGGGNGNDIWGWTDLITGKEYAIMGLTNGTAFVDISDPVNPVFLGHLPPHSGVSNSSWRDIKTYSDHAFIGSEALNSGMQVVDLTQLRDIVSPPGTIVETAFYSGFSSSHNIVINEDSGYAYGVGLNNGNCARGLHFVDIVNPTNPQSAGCFSSDGYTHDAQCVNYIGPDPDHQGKEICFAYNEDTLTIVDVSIKSSPIQISRTGYSNRGYSHQGWLTDDHEYLLLDDELDERNVSSITNTRTLIWDVSDLDNPVHQGDYSGVSTSVDHNQYIIGDYSFQSNYRSGLRILDISGIASNNLSEVAFFDIYPANDSANFNGAWSVYPFFASGNVIVSGIEQGLYILRPNLSEADMPPEAFIVNPANNDPTPITGSIQVQITATDVEDVEGTLTVEWNVDGGGWQPANWTAPFYVANWDSSSVLDGAHVINARAIDSYLHAGGDASNVTTQNGTPIFSVDGVEVSITSGRGNRNTGEAIVSVSDKLGDPLDGVAIEGSFSGDGSGTLNSTTDSNGQVSFNTPRVKNLSFVQFCVELASKAGWELEIADSTFCGNSDGGGNAFGTVAGRITNAQGVDGITNAAVSTDTGQSASSDAFGGYSIDNVPVGNRNVSVTASGYEGQNTPASVSENTITTVNFSLNESSTNGAGTIKGTVYSYSGGKIGDVTLQVMGGTSSQTNRGGKYTIQNVPAMLQTVFASKDGFLSQEKDIQVIAGASVSLNFTLTPD
jgi:choice-of-anchor B domain-containing protein